ncbi:MAG TPA: Flp pilus assembly protein CpaB [Candidatus Acidoferrales bacterium]|nr:Flp pilus assembly protein CpaB [Candidatus Acidoferrales bacterium]
MDRRRILMALAVAVPLALLASILVYRQLSRAASSPGRIAPTKIVVAAAPLAPGTRLDAKDLRQIGWPASGPMQGMFARPEDCVGRVLMSPLLENEPVLEGSLAPKDSSAGLPAMIPPGMRGLSVAVNDVVGVAGFVQPGTSVDVLATGGIEGQGSILTRTILEGIRVLAAGQKIQPDKDGTPQTVAVVTLLVTPDQANTLTLASTQGRIQLALRNFGDTKQVNTSPALLGDIFGTSIRLPLPHGDRPLARVSANPAAPKPYEVEVIRGNKPEISAIPQK